MPRHAMTREQALKALELHPGASFQEIKQAYRDLALVWHWSGILIGSLVMTLGYGKRRLRGSRRSTAHTMCCDRTMTVLQGLTNRGQSTPGPGRAHPEQSNRKHRDREATQKIVVPGRLRTPPTSSERTGRERENSGRTGRDREAVIPARLPNTQNPETRETGLVVSGTGGRPSLAAASSVC